MSVDLTELDATVRSTLAQLECDEFDKPDRLRSIRWAGNYFLRKTMAARATFTKATVNGTDTLDVTTAVSDFQPARLIGLPYIDATDNGLQVVDFKQVLYQRDTYGAASGRPEMIGWQTPAVAQLYPNPDAVYTITFVYWQTLTSFSVNVNLKATTTLNLPASYLDEVALGAAAQLLRGYEDMAGARRELRAEFEAAIGAARGEFATLFGPAAPPVGMDNSYARRRRI